MSKHRKRWWQLLLSSDGPTAYEPRHARCACKRDDRCPARHTDAPHLGNPCVYCAHKQRETEPCDTTELCDESVRHP